jgi:hypothetical protein
MSAQTAIDAAIARRTRRAGARDVERIEDIISG